MHSRAHAFLTHPLAASSLASWQPGLATSCNNTQPAIDVDLVIPNHLYTDLDFFAIFQFLAPPKFLGPSPHLGTANRDANYIPPIVW